MCSFASPAQPGPASLHAVDGVFSLFLLLYLFMGWFVDQLAQSKCCTEHQSMLHAKVDLFFLPNYYY